MSALWILFVSFCVSLHFEHHEAGFIETGIRTPEQLLKKPYQEGRGDGGLLQLQRFVGMQAKINKMPKEGEDQNVSRGEFDKAMAYVNNAFTLLNAEVGALQAEITNATQVSNEQFSAQEDRITTLENDEIAVGFTAYLDEVVLVSHGQVIPFTSVDTNIGGGYDASISKFTCPVNGLYFFSASTFTDESNSVIQLTRQGSGYIGAYSNKEGLDQGTISWVVTCSKDDQVWCMLMNSEATLEDTVNSIPISLSAFSGFLIARN